MIARVPIFTLIVASLAIAFIPDTHQVFDIPLRWLLCGLFCAWWLWLYYRIKQPRCPKEQQRMMIEMLDGAMKLARNEQQRRCLIAWCKAQTDRHKRLT